MSSPNFSSMTAQQAVDYCYKYRKEFLRDAYASGEDGVQQFECLIVIIESGTVKPSELPSYGMDYGEA